jgi:hypothetical protein
MPWEDGLREEYTRHLPVLKGDDGRYLPTEKPLG